MAPPKARDRKCHLINIAHLISHQWTSKIEIDVVIGLTQLGRHLAELQLFLCNMTKKDNIYNLINLLSEVYRQVMLLQEICFTVTYHADILYSVQNSLNVVI